MIEKFVVEDLKYCLLPGKYFGFDFKATHAEIFRFWQWQWSEAFDQINLPFAKTSDEFCRHEEVTALIYQDQIVACALVDYFNVQSEVQKNHHYFSNYPDGVLERFHLMSQGHPLFTFGYLAVHPSFRKNFGFSDIILGLALRRMKETTSQLMITYTRNTRRTHDLTYRLGAQSLLRDFIVKGEPSDFVYFDEESLLGLSKNKFSQEIESLWKNKIFVPSLNVVHQPKKGRSLETNEFERRL